MRVIVVHTIDHAIAALDAAADLKVSPVLQSAPDAIFYAGGLYIKEMFDAAAKARPDCHARFIVDCADAQAEAIAAIETGHTTLRSSAPEPVRAKLADIAGQYGAELVTEPCEALDLQLAGDTSKACREWLSRTH